MKTTPKALEQFREYCAARRVEGQTFSVGLKCSCKECNGELAFFAEPVPGGFKVTAQFQYQAGWPSDRAVAYECMELAPTFEDAVDSMVSFAEGVDWRIEERTLN